MRFWHSAPAALIFALACSAQEPEPDSGGAEYVVAFSDDDFPTAHVTAVLTVTGGAITMSDFWASFFDDPRGWAGFVTIESAQDASGAALPVAETAPHGWLLGDGYSGVATVAYTVDYSFADQRWDAGNEQVALHVGDALFTTGLPLFVFAPATTSARVRFELPDGAAVATAWPDADGVYEPTSLDRLLRNALVVGDHHQSILEAGGMELRIALLGEIARSGDRVERAGADILNYYVEMFDERRPSQFLMVVIPGPNDGEGYFDSFASSQPNAPVDHDVAVWAGSIAHEFLHYWNGKKIASAWETRAERQWFSEGFTEYFAVTALRDLGYVDDRRFEEIMSQYLSFHAFFAVNPNYADVTLRTAGASKWANRPGVYDSGTAAAFCLDGEIRAASGGDRDLSDLMRLMNDRFGRTGDFYVYDDIVAAASEIAGRDLSAYFDAHVSGKEPLPLTTCATQMGYRATVDGYHVMLRSLDQ